MAGIQGAKTKELLPIAWLNTSNEKDAWTKYKYLSPFLEGARERCLLLGYRIDEFWTRQPGMTMRRISQILYQRGIDAAIVTYPARHVRLKWDHMACVALGGALLAPRLHRVMGDFNFNLTLALKVLRRYGYRRIGISQSEGVDQFTQRIYRSIAYHLLATSESSDQIPPLFYIGISEDEAKNKLAPWVRRYRPEVIVSSDGRMVDWIRELGLRVPKDIGVIHLSLDEDVLDWAGIHSNKREIGAAAAEWVISMAQNHRYGVPKTGLITLVRGSWQTGRTLQTPKIK